MSNNNPDKPFKTYIEQIDILKNRYNLTISNDTFAEKALKSFTYYDLINGYKDCFMHNNQFDKNIIFEAALFSYELSFDNRITLVGGDSGTGKTVLYDMLEDLWLTDQYHATRLFNYKSDNLEENLKKCRNCFIVIDNADILMDDEIRRFINFEFSNQYMLFLRNCDGLNVSDKSFKVMSLESNKITLKEREIEDGNINTIGCCAESIG